LSVALAEFSCGAWQKSSMPELTYLLDTRDVLCDVLNADWVLDREPV
jgi:hypothetical protein